MSHEEVTDKLEGNYLGNYLSNKATFGLDT